MKLKTYNTQLGNFPRTHGKPVISINGQHGLFSLSGKFITEIGINLEEYPYVNFHQDHDRPEDWYVEFTKDSTGFKLRKSKGAAFNCSGLARYILRSAGLDEKKSHILLMATKPMVYPNYGPTYAIITKSIKS